MFPIFTGDAARLLATTERRLNELIRDRKIDPPPAVVGGRRLWHAIHVEQAARLLGVPPPADTGRSSPPDVAANDSTGGTGPEASDAV